ncbi:MAG: S8 family peptidase, partial [Bacteroidota bacterium]
IQLLAEQVEVKTIIKNSAFRIEQPLVETTAAPRDLEWGIEMINADDVWAMGYRGQGVVVGGQDTGYDWQHPALIGKYRGWDGSTADHNYNWHDAIHEINPLNGDPTPDPSNNPCGLDSPFPCDDGSHGTHTMGTIVGSEGENEIGVAPDAKWVACRNMERGWGSPVSYIECFEWLMAPTDLNNENPDPGQSPHVFANSWSCPEIEGCDASNWSVMETVVNNVKASGIVVVVSAGNSGSNGCSSVSTPAAMFENSFTIGSTRPNDRISGFSSRGPVLVDNSGRMKPNVSAPGSQVRSSVPGNDYATFSGTSMAGPHVVGLVALMISANPALAGQVETIEDLIEQTAVPKTIEDEDCGELTGLEVPNNTYGYGRVDALAAVEAALSLTPTEEVVAHEAFAVYPNPVVDRLFFDFKTISGKVNLALFNTKGQQIGDWRWEVGIGEQKSVDLSSMPTGVYFYTLETAADHFEGKVLRH